VLSRRLYTYGSSKDSSSLSHCTVSRWSRLDTLTPCIPKILIKHIFPIFLAVSPHRTHSSTCLVRKKKRRSKVFPFRYTGMILSRKLLDFGARAQAIDLGCCRGFCKNDVNISYLAVNFATDHTSELLYVYQEIQNTWPGRNIREGFRTISRMVHRSVKLTSQSRKKLKVA
jgi:hypothetical protein